MDAEHPSRDDGSALILVLVLVIVASLIVLPVMSYAVSILRVNTVLSSKTKRMEAVRGALRVALAEPVKLYEVCGEAGPTTPRSLASAGIEDIDVASRCYFIDFASAQDENELRYGLTVTQVDAEVPVELVGSRYPTDELADPADPMAWLADSRVDSVTDTIWLPNLPVHALNLRSAAPYTMPAGFAPCSVYFPGTYRDDVVLDGPTYFASGVYYFESEVLVTDGADVVVGQGAIAGCSTDQEVAFYVEDPPGTHNINGQGATWVFGDEGRLVVRNEASDPISLRLNQRYVLPDDTGTASSQGVSIMTVNGAVVDEVAGALDVEDLIHVPLSLVGSVDPVAAPVQEYAPSIHTPAPRAPSSPIDVTSQARNLHARVTWSPPPLDGGSPITGYTATLLRSGESHTCDTPPDRTDCTVGGLTNGHEYTVEVVATNEIGSSAPAAGAAVTPATGAGFDVTVPGVPAITSVTPYEGAVEVAWTPPADDGNAPIIQYDVLGTPAGSCTAGYGETSCVVIGIDPLEEPDEYVFRLTATNMIGSSGLSVPSAAVQPIGDAVPELEPYDPQVEPFVPDPVVDLDLAGTSAVTVAVPGYVSIPQGRFRLHNPAGHDVYLEGGLLAATYDVLDGRAGDPDSPDPDSIPVGFVELIVQRKLRIVSETVGGSPRVVSTAIVQVNQNGGYAINSWEVR